MAVLQCRSDEGLHYAALGQAARPDRRRFPSAHNYYLDYLYRFGVLALVPVLCLILCTARRSLQRRLLLWRRPELTGLAGVLACLVLADSLLKVGMYQPYSGILTFYLWSLLLSQLAIPSVAGSSNGTSDMSRATTREEQT